MKITTCPHCDKPFIEEHQHKCKPNRVMHSQVIESKKGNFGIDIYILTIGACPNGDYVVVAKRSSAFGMGAGVVPEIQDQRFNKKDDAWEYYNDFPIKLKLVRK